MMQFDTGCIFIKSLKLPDKKYSNFIPNIQYIAFAMNKALRNRIGFEHLNLLVNLSKADNEVAKEEIEMIMSVGEIYGFTPEEVNEILNAPIATASRVGSLTLDERFEILYNIIQLMKIDGKVLQSEIEFCEKVAIKLGYLPGVVADLSAYIYSDPKITTEKSILRKIADTNWLKRNKKA